MLTILLRHYRRIATFAGGLGLFCTVLLSCAGAQIPSIAYVGLFVIFATLFCAIAVAVYAIVPRHRSLLEISGSVGFLTVGFLMLFASTGWGVVAAGLALFIIGTGAVWWFLNSAFSKRIGTKTNWRDRHSGHVPYPARLVWRHVVPGAAEPIDHCTDMMESYEEDAEDPDTVHVTFKGRKARNAQYTLTFLERDEPSSCRFFFQGHEADSTLVDGVFSLHLSILDRDSCFMSCVEERSGLSLGALLERWFDDALGYQYDKLIEKLDALYGETYGQRKATIVAAE